MKGKDLTMRSAPIRVGPESNDIDLVSKGVLRERERRSTHTDRGDKAREDETETGSVPL